MAAAYPNNVATFTQKANFVEDVDASHPNSVQDEIVAIETVLGASPQVDQVAAPSGVFVNYGTVSKRITAASKNTNAPIAEFLGINTPMTPPNTYTYMYWNGKRQDSHSAWNGGATFYCPRSGFYLANFHVQWNPGIVPVGEDEESYYSYIIVANTQVATQSEPLSSQFIPRYTLTWLGTWTKGQSMNFAVYHGMDYAVNIDVATMSFAMIKDFS